MNKRFAAIFIVIVCIVAGIVVYNRLSKNAGSSSSQTTYGTTTNEPNLLSIEYMRKKAYPGSDIVIEQTLPQGSNYHRYIVSYKSDGLKIYGLLTVPVEQKPVSGWPVILFNHGYISPNQYSTESSYAGIVNEFASAGFIVFKPDYRGNGNSQGSPAQVYVSPDYTTDGMNALSSIKSYADANPDKVGVWGHSMGGNITLRELTVTNDFKAAVIMSGVVGSYSDILDWWKNRVATHVLTTQNDLETEKLVRQMVVDHKTPKENPGFWDSVDPTYFVSDIKTPALIQVGTADTVVPPSFSQFLKDALQNAGGNVALHSYPGADHNLSPDTSLAVAEAITFFDKYLKN